jgi:hypothetical protein
VGSLERQSRRPVAGKGELTAARRTFPFPNTQDWLRSNTWPCLVEELGAREIPDIAAAPGIPSYGQNFSVGQQGCGVVGAPSV